MLFKKKETVEVINKTKNSFLEKDNKIDKPLVNLTQKKWRDSQIFRNNTLYYFYTYRKAIL